MTAPDPLRVRAFTLTFVDLANEQGPVRRELLEVRVSDLFGPNRPASWRTLNLVFDRNQLATLRTLLLQLELPDMPSPPDPEGR